MNEKGLPATKVLDQDAKGDTFTLEGIDPFTFLGCFNRGQTDKKRIQLWKGSMEPGIPPPRGLLRATAHATSLVRGLDKGVHLSVSQVEQVLEDLWKSGTSNT